MKNFKTSIVDTPRKGGNDLFEIDKYKKGLTKFLENADSPLTVALQGEWGSGKTSLMNSILSDLCESNENSSEINIIKPYYGVWVNTWQFSLMKSKDDAILSIITALTNEILQIIKSKHESKTEAILKDASKMLGRLFKAGTKVVGSQIGIEGEVMDSFLGKGSEDSVDLISFKKALQDAINQCLELDRKEGNNNKGFLFFIDDLDRIDPVVAVEILELLKNIFDLENCIFILAIDYDVVIKGLKPKFGELTDKNEREFRSFFDKIIQMPFSMPVSSYVIDDFLKEKLLVINYFENQELENNETFEVIKQISLYSVGTNPRSLKRLINSLSLIKCINDSIPLTEIEKKEEGDEELIPNVLLDKIMNFALVSIQISYPSIYDLLVKEPDFKKWDERVAMQENLPHLTDELKLKLSVQPEFDEEWEQVLFRKCEKDIYLQKNALNVSRLFNYLTELAIKNNEPNIGELIGAVISLSSVTNMATNEKPKIDYHRGELLKQLRWKVISQLKSKPELETVKNLIQNQGARVQTNAYIKFTEKDWGRWIQFHSHPHNGKIRLIIISSLWFEKTNDFTNLLKGKGELENVIKIQSEMQSNIRNLSPDNVEFYDWQEENGVFRSNNNPEFFIYNYLILPSVEAFNLEENINIISNIAYETYHAICELYKVKDRMIN